MKINKLIFIFFLSNFIIKGNSGVVDEMIAIYDPINNPCFSGSILQDDLLICVTKYYINNVDNLNKNYEIAIKQKNNNIKDYIINSQNHWDKIKFSSCNDILGEDGQERNIDYISCIAQEVKDRSELIEQLFLCGGDSYRYPCDIEEEVFYKKIRNVGF